MLEILEITGAILASLGGAAVILYGLSSWIGKLWADRLIEIYKRELDLK